MASLNSLSLTFLALLFHAISSDPVIHAIVPSSATFSYKNHGNFGNGNVEYKANYRPLPSPLVAFPFSLCFYNTTPNAYTLALLLGDYSRSMSVMRLVWEANRGKPVYEGATLTFSHDGNLVLADADGSVAWQTGTANKGVTGFNLLSNGNLDLFEKNGEFVWQSFDHPTDTLLVGQVLRPQGPNKLVSRVSVMDGSEGYSYIFALKKWSYAFYTLEARILQSLCFISILKYFTILSRRC